MHHHCALFAATRGVRKDRKLQNRSTHQCDSVSAHVAAWNHSRALHYPQGLNAILAHTNNMENDIITLNTQ